MELNSFTRIDERTGKEVSFDVLFTFDSQDTLKSYIVYTDYSTNEDGTIIIYASIYNPDDKDLNLIPIEDESEWQLIETMTENISKDIVETLKIN